MTAIPLTLYPTRPAEEAVPEVTEAVMSSWIRSGIRVACSYAGDDPTDHSWAIRSPNDLETVVMTESAQAT